MIKLLITIALTSLGVIYSQTTQVYILGSIHEETENINIDDIYQTVSNLNPDVVLLETDSSSFDNGMNFIFKLTPKIKSNEFYIAYSLSQTTDIIFRPFDIPNRPDLYYGKNGVLSNQIKAYNKTLKAYNKGTLSPENEKLFAKLLDLDYLTDSLMSLPLRDLNSKKSSDAFRDFSEYQNNQLTSIIKSEDELSNIIELQVKNAQFDKMVDDKMAKNILNSIREFSGKKILVIVGMSHKPLMIDNLTPHQKEYNFSLKKIFTTE